MKIARVTGTVVSTIKYEKYVGMKLLRVRHLTLDGQPTGEELIALDAADAGVGQQRRRRGADDYGRYQAHRQRYHLRRD